MSQQGQTHQPDQPEQIKTPASNVAPIKKASRAKSTETILKEKKRKLDRDLTILDKKVEDFEKLEKEMNDVDKDRKDVQAELTKVKEALMKELGLD